MINNYLKIAFRSLKKQKIYAVINVLGLSIGLTAVIILTSYVYYHFSFDKNQTNYSKIYRPITTFDYTGGKALTTPVIQAGIGTHLEEKFEQIESSALIYTLEMLTKNTLESNDEKRLKGYYSTPGFIKIFDVPVIDGDLEHVLREPFYIAFDEETALKYTGTKNPVGQKFEFNERDYTIGAVFKNISHNSHLKFNTLISLESKKAENKNFIQNQGFSFYLYFTLNDSSPALKKEIIEEITNFVKSDAPESIKENISFKLQPLKDIHLKSNYQFEISSNNSYLRIILFLSIGLAILVLALINYINLTTARLDIRFKEIGIRKSVGAARKQIILQFFTESFILVTIAFFLSFLVIELIYPYFTNLMELPVKFSPFNNFAVFASLIFIYLLTGLTAGFYPAFLTLKYETADILRGSLRLSDNSFLRKGLIIGQFFITFILLTSIFFFYKQINYMKTKDLGFDSDNIVVFKNFTKGVEKNLPQIRSALENLAFVEKTAISANEIGVHVNKNPYSVIIKGEKVEILADEYKAEHNFFKMLELKVIAGDLNKKNGIIVNQKLINSLGLKNPIGKDIKGFNGDYKIKAVVKNFHYKNMKEDIGQLVMTQSSSFSTLYLRFNNHEFLNNIEKIQEIFRNSDPNYSLSYYFLNNLFKNMYKSDEKEETLFIIAFIIAFSLSLVGLIALVSFLTERNTKNIGIRKVLGATSYQIILKYQKEILSLIVIGCSIAIPVSIYFLKNWLQNFAYKIELNLTPFIVSVFIIIFSSVLASILIVSKAANQNPALSLKNE